MADPNKDLISWSYSLHRFDRAAGCDRQTDRWTPLRDALSI